jgi:hypothetical protein
MMMHIYNLLPSILLYLQLQLIEVLISLTQCPDTEDEFECCLSAESQIPFVWIAQPRCEWTEGVEVFEETGEQVEWMGNETMKRERKMDIPG